MCTLKWPHAFSSSSWRLHVQSVNWKESGHKASGARMIVRAGKLLAAPTWSHAKNVLSCDISNLNIFKDHLVTADRVKSSSSVIDESVSLDTSDFYSCLRTPPDALAGGNPSLRVSRNNSIPPPRPLHHNPATAASALHSSWIARQKNPGPLSARCAVTGGQSDWREMRRKWGKGGGRKGSAGWWGWGGKGGEGGGLVAAASG